MITWHEIFVAIEHHLRASGWTCAFTVHGRRIRPIGIVSPDQQRLVHHNDN